MQRVNQIVFKGTNEDWSLGGNSENNYRNYCYQHWLGSDSRYYAGTYTTPCISSHFSHKTSVNSYSGTEIGTTAHGSNIYLRLGLNTQYTDVNQFKSFLAEQYAAGNPLTHIYILATPIETPLSAEQLLAYAALHTNEPNTTIMNDGNAGMEVKYYTPSTAVQMVHSPSDEGKILSIDEHGCVVLSELDAGSIDIDLDGTNNGEINSINADTLGGVPSNNYVLKDELEGLMPDGSNNSSVLYIQQDLTEAQQAQVRENIGIDTYITACIEEALLGGEW